jgi:hypothetical protein
MGDGLLHLVAKYFYLISLDERLTYTASLKVLHEIRSNHWEEPDFRSQWVAVMSKWRSRLAVLRPKDLRDQSEKNYFQIPAELNLPSWISFLTSSSPEDAEAVILSRVLSFSDEEIADGLKITSGTVRYRVGHGLRHLGGFIEA